MELEQRMCELGQKIYNKSVDSFINRMRSIAHNLNIANLNMPPISTQEPEKPFKPHTPRYVAETAERRKNTSQADLSYTAMTLMQYERMMENSDDLFRPNLDIPQAAASLEWGMSDPSYHTLFASEMDKRDFQERCYNPPNSQKLYRLEQRHSDQKPWHLQIERIMKWLDCDYQTAHAFSDCFEKLSLDRAAVVKIVFGYMSNGKRKKGIKGTGITHLPYMMSLVDDTAIPDTPEDAMNFISSSGDDVEAIGQVFQKLHRYGCEAVEEDFELTEDFLYQNEKEDISFNSAVFTAKELGRDELSLDDDLIQEIRTATWDDLKIIVKRMFSEHVENEYGGYWKAPVYRNKYPSWVSDFWLRIADRKKAIIKLAYRYKVQPTLQENFKLLKKIPSAKQRWFMAQTMIKGGTFSFNGKKLQFTKCQPHERVVIEYALSIVNKKLANK
jgi:hypothetical protein